jgi:hypothetical protein
MKQSECQKERVRESVLERTCWRKSESDCQRERVRESVRKHVRERESQMVRDCMSEFHCVRAGSTSRLSVPVLTGVLSLLEPHYLLLTHPRNLSQLD